MEAQIYAPIALSKERGNNRERLQSRGKNNDEQISPNEESTGIEQENIGAFFKVRKASNNRVSQNVKLVVDSGREVLIDTEAALRGVTGTGSYVIAIVIIIIDTMIKETRGNQKESLSRPRKIRTVQVTDLITCKLLKDRCDLPHKH